MKEMKSKIFYIFIGVLFTFSILFIVSAWNPNAWSGSSTNSVSICCSSDGNIIYVTDYNGVNKSSDGGNTWQIVLGKK
jgi:hypothetical protein